MPIPTVAQCTEGSDNDLLKVMFCGHFQTELDNAMCMKNRFINISWDYEDGSIYNLFNGNDNDVTVSLTEKCNLQSDWFNQSSVWGHRTWPLII